MKKKIESLYVHFPFCRHLCNYCDFYKKIPESSSDYSSFEKQLAQMFCANHELLNQHDYECKQLETLYIGGGTPSLWGERGADFLAQAFREHGITLVKDSGEFTLEVNPGSWTEEGLEAWQRFGINRYSLGVQTLHPDYLKKIDRVHNVDDVHETLEYFSNCSHDFSVDFMLGLPRVTGAHRDIKSELEEILKYNPKHISLYILTVKDHYVHLKDIPSDEVIAEEYMLVSELLKREGFEHYEVSNYARRGHTSKHNLMYWQSRSVAALGPSAVGYLAESALRYKWKPSSIDYVVEQLTPEEVHLEKIYMSLRIKKGLRLDDFQIKEADSLVETWVEKGHALIQGDFVCLTSKGFLLLDSLMDEIFTHSKTL